MVLMVPMLRGWFFFQIFTRCNIPQLYLSGSPGFQLFPFIKNDAGSPEGQQVAILQCTLLSIRLINSRIQFIFNHQFIQLATDSKNALIPPNSEQISNQL